MPHDAKDLDLEELVGRVTDTVLSALRASSPQPPRGAQLSAQGRDSSEGFARDAPGAPRCHPSRADGDRPARRLVLLLPSPSPGLWKTIERCRDIWLDRGDLLILGSDLVVSDGALLPHDLPIGTTVEPLSRHSTSALLASMTPGDALVLGSMGFGLAKRLSSLDDDDPFVRLLIAASLRGLPVLLLRDDLEPRPGTPSAIRERAECLLREIERLGLDVRSSFDLEAWVEKTTVRMSTTSKIMGNLVAEADIDSLHASGERRLVLPNRTILTPLARARAAALGLELVEEPGD